MTLTDEIRDAIRRSGKTVYRIALDVQMEDKRLSRFVQGKAGLSLATLNRLAAHLGLSFNAGPRPLNTDPTHDAGR